MSGDTEYRFGVFTADLQSGELYKSGARIKLQERPFQLLVALLERPGEVISREELRQRLWPDGTYVDFDHNISSTINKLRAALSDSATHSRYIETVGRRGYRFVADVKLVAKVSTEVPLAETAVRNDNGNFSQKPIPRPRRWLIVTAAVALVLALTLTYFNWSSNPRPASIDHVALAVFPLENLTGDPAQDYFSEGLSEEIATQFGRFDSAEFTIVPLRTDPMHYPRSPQQLEQVAAQLGVQYALRGSVRRDARNVRVAVQLIHLPDHAQTWAQAYEREHGDVLTLQGEIAQEVADEIQLILGKHVKQTVAASAKPATLTSQEYEAYDLYLRGRYFWNKRSVQGFEQAAQNFQRAIQLAPNFARPYSGLADTYSLMASYFLAPPSQLIPKAREAALKALQLDDNLAEAHTSLALIAENYDWDWQTAEKEYRRAIQLDPSYATAHQWYAEYLTFQGRFDEALAESERARQLDPLSLIIATDSCAALYYARQYDRAIAKCKSVAAMDPDYARVRGLLVMNYAQLGRSSDVVSESKSWLQTYAEPWYWTYTAVLYEHAGQSTKAWGAVHGLEALSKSNKLATEVLPIAYSAVGDKDRAIRGLEREASEHGAMLTTIKVDPVYDPLRDDPRFQELLREVHLQP